MGPSHGISWETLSLFHHLNACRFLQPELMKFYFPGTGTLGYVVCPGLEPWIATSPVVPLGIYLHTNVKLPSLPPTTSPRVLSALAAHLCLSYQCG